MWHSYPFDACTLFYHLSRQILMPRSQETVDEVIVVADDLG